MRKWFEGYEKLSILWQNLLFTTLPPFPSVFLLPPRFSLWSCFVWVHTRVVFCYFLGQSRVVASHTVLHSLHQSFPRRFPKPWHLAKGKGRNSHVHVHLYCCLSASVYWHRCKTNRKCRGHVVLCEVRRKVLADGFSVLCTAANFFKSVHF